MSKAMQWLSFLSVIVGIVKEAIEAVEAPGFGAEKKKAVLEVVATFFPLFPGIPGDLVLAATSAIIDVIVGINNLTGKFKKLLNVNEASIIG